MNSFLSVVTICFNNLPELKETCRSIDVQTRLSFEHLIIDGSENQEILLWLQSKEQPGYRKWIHERDNGISDALNKGITHANGDIIHLLHAGDKYYDAHATEEVLKHFENDAALMWTHSLYVQHRGDVDVISGAPFIKQKLWKGMRTVAHPTMFLKKEVYDRVGFFDLKYKIAMDYDLVVRIKDEKFYFINKPLVYFSPGGASNTQFKKGLKEVQEIYKKRIGKSYRMSLWQLRQKLLNSFMQTIAGKAIFVLKNKKKLKINAD